MSYAKELGIGVIGVGCRGGLAGGAHRPDEGSRVVAGADISDRGEASFRSIYGPDAFFSRDYRELLDRPDVNTAFILTPDHLHEEQAIAALEAGMDVFLEKPIAITIEGADRILRTAVKTGRKLYVGHNMRHMPFTMKMKELIDTGAIGEVKAAWCRHFVGYGGYAYFNDWHAERKNSTGLLLQKGAHDIDILHWLCGGTSRRVNAMGALSVYGNVTHRHDRSKAPPDPAWGQILWPPMALKGLNPNMDVEDISMMQMQLDNGVLASYGQCHFTPDSWRNYTIIGTEGRIENFGTEPGDCVVRVWNRRTVYNMYGDEQHFIHHVPGGHGGADPRIIDEFVRYVRDDAKITTSAVAARDAVAAGCMATQSLRNGGAPVDVPPVPGEIIAYFDADLKEQEKALRH